MREKTRSVAPGVAEYSDIDLRNAGMEVEEAAKSGGDAGEGRACAARVAGRV
jgi:hypothetical protein